MLYYSFFLLILGLRWYIKIFILTITVVPPNFAILSFYGFYLRLSCSLLQKATHVFMCVKHFDNWLLSSLVTALFILRLVSSIILIFLPIDSSFFIQAEVLIKDYQLKTRVHVLHCIIISVLSFKPLLDFLLLHCNWQINNIITLLWQKKKWGRIYIFPARWDYGNEFLHSLNWNAMECK